MFVHKPLHYTSNVVKALRRVSEYSQEGASDWVANSSEVDTIHKATPHLDLGSLEPFSWDVAVHPYMPVILHIFVNGSW